MTTEYDLPDVFINLYVGTGLYTILCDRNNESKLQHLRSLPDFTFEMFAQVNGEVLELRRGAIESWARSTPESRRRDRRHNQMLLDEDEPEWATP